jgi:hypothetical protein
VSKRLSVWPQGTTRLPLQVFLCNLIFHFVLKICHEISSFITIRQVLTAHHMQTHRTFLTISRSVLLRMRNVSDKSCRENQNTHFVFSKFFPRKSCRLWDNVEKYYRAGQVTDGNIKRRMRNAHRIPKATNTHSEYGITIVFHYNNGCTNSPQCYTTLSVLLLFCAHHVPCLTWSVHGFFPRKSRFNPMYILCL